jgi:hypothetical protein
MGYSAFSKRASKANNLACSKNTSNRNSTCAFGHENLEPRALEDAPSGLSAGVLHISFMEIV